MTQDGQLGALEEMVQAYLLGLRAMPLDLLDRRWFEGVTELLLAMHPDCAVGWRHRVRQDLARHAVLHGCQAVERFDARMEEALHAWIASGT